MSQKLEVVLDIRGLLYDGFSAYRGMFGGGSVLGYIDSALNAGTATLSLINMFGGGGLGSSIVAWKANELKLLISIAQ